ncbi:MAG TPA: hypothetical protein VE954_38150 [Oligoflexus sp.]|uniref:hypothetical protein n=1 Tax=Oligoflexus sp. TaxID=1971216 RepID=UPI002D3282A0|nr:hypothetical protein [Oligoflexus sp.]HYX38962.1 hypothetical protein [Oligoflexus sp.]
MKFFMLIMTLAMAAGCATVDSTSASSDIQAEEKGEEGLRESWQKALLEAVER